MERYFHVLNGLRSSYSNELLQSCWLNTFYRFLFNFIETANKGSYITLPRSRIDVDFGDNVAALMSVLCHPDDFSNADASQHYEKFILLNKNDTYFLDLICFHVHRLQGKIKYKNKSSSSAINLS